MSLRNLSHPKPSLQHISAFLSKERQGAKWKHHAWELISDIREYQGKHTHAHTHMHIPALLSCKIIVILDPAPDFLATVLCDDPRPHTRLSLYVHS